MDALLDRVDRLNNNAATVPPRCQRLHRLVLPVLPRQSLVPRGSDAADAVRTHTSHLSCLTTVPLEESVVCC